MNLPRRDSGWVSLLLVLLGLSIGTAGIAVEQKEKKAGGKAEEKKEKEKEGLPLKPERKIEFSTDEGTWLSLDENWGLEAIYLALLVTRWYLAQHPRSEQIGEALWPGFIGRAYKGGHGDLSLDRDDRWRILWAEGKLKSGIPGRYC